MRRGECAPTDGTLDAVLAPVVSKILLALDDSPYATRVVTAGALLAVRFGASLHPIRVLTARNDVLDGVPDEHVREATIALGEIARSLMDVLVAPPRVRVGEPWREILELATESGADLIVLGARGHGTQALGATAGAVLSHAPMNVFVVRDLTRRSTT